MKATQCPYPGTSYCEPFSLGGSSTMQGFATRMSLVNLTVGIREETHPALDGLVAWPNPSSGTFTFALQGSPIGQGLVDVFDATGRFVARATLANSRCDLSSLAKGCYLTRIRSTTNRIIGSTKLTIVR